MKVILSHIRTSLNINLAIYIHLYLHSFSGHFRVQEVIVEQCSECLISLLKVAIISCFGIVL